MVSRACALCYAVSAQQKNLRAFQALSQIACALCDAPHNGKCYWSGNSLLLYLHTLLGSCLTFNKYLKQPQTSTTPLLNTHNHVHTLQWLWATVQGLGLSSLSSLMNIYMEGYNQNNILVYL